MTDDEFDNLQAEYDLCGVDGRLRDFAEAVQAAERERHAYDVHSCHANCNKAGCVNVRLRSELQQSEQDARDNSALADRAVRQAASLYHALRRVKMEAVSLADAQVIALEALGPNV